MVLDWGGGTFDITVLTISYSHDQCPNILVQSIEGLCDVRGRDVDDELLQSILDRIEIELDQDFGVDLTFISDLRVKGDHSQSASVEVRLL